MSSLQPSRGIIKTRRGRQQAEDDGLFPPTGHPVEIHELDVHKESLQDSAASASEQPAGGQANTDPSNTIGKLQTQTTNGSRFVAPAEQIARNGMTGFPAYSTQSYIPPEKQLGFFATSAMIINRVVGSGIFDLSPTLLSVIGSKGAAMLTWLLGCLVSWAGMIVYVEYGTRFPLSGGELYYIDFVWLKPTALVTYMYAIMFTILSGSQGNALSFGSAVQVAATPSNPVVNTGLQKLLAIVIVGFSCLGQAYSRGFNVLVSDAIGVYKVLLLSFIAVTGWVALGGVRSPSAREAYSTPYGKENFANSFAGTSNSVFNWGIGLLLTQRAFLGYENANLILEEIRRPVGDPSRVFRRSAKTSITLLCVLYVLVNVAFFAACSDEELRNTPDVTALFFSKVFGPSTRARQASGVLRALSSGGNVIAFSYSAVKVKQEIARLGILPFPEFFAKSTLGGTPGPALLLHFFFTSLFVVCSPLDNANGYLIISTLFTWTRTWVGVLLGLGIIHARWNDVFSKGGVRWSPASMPSFGYIGRLMVVPLAVLYTIANAFIFGLCWVPSNFQKDLGTESPVLPSYTGPIVGTAISLLGGVYWIWDRQILRALGYRMEVGAERGEGYDVKMSFIRWLRPKSIPDRAYEKVKGWKQELKSLLPDRRASDIPSQEPLRAAYHAMGSENIHRIGY